MTLRGQFSRYVLVGGVATLAHYLILISLVQLSLCDPVLASSIGFAMSALLNYALNAQFTFQSSDQHRRTFPRFAIVALSGLALNALLIWISHDLLNVQYIIAQLGATSCTLAWSFGLNKMWTFSPSTSNKGSLR